MSTRSEHPSSPAAPHPVVLFDGVCNLCNATVQFIVDRDPAARFRFASLQSEAASGLLAAHGAAALPSGAAPDSVMLVKDGRVFDRSTAALHVARALTWPWKLAWVFIVVPRPLRDLVYRFIAKHRYRWFGRTDSCRVPTPELRARFL